MNRYESSRSESKHQHQYAKNAEQEQRADDAKKSYNPLYPEKNDARQSGDNGESNIQQDSEESPENENNDQDQQQSEHNNSNS